MKQPNFFREAERWLHEEHLFLFTTVYGASRHAHSYIFSRPLEVVSAYTSAETAKALVRIGRYSKKYYCVGFLSYELGYVLEDYFECRERFSFPLLCFGIFNKPIMVHEGILSPGFRYRRGKPASDLFSLSRFRMNISKKEYAEKVARIKRFIEKGDIYQANLTVKYRFDVRGDLWAFYRRLLCHQPVPYGAFIKIRNRYILSLSPELFFRREGALMHCRPMKGTLQRGTTHAEDCVREALLERDAKNRAENVMIVDLVRNDLSKISQARSVKVERLFQVERYKTLLQMVSIVRGRLNARVSYGDIFRALFPCGSIVGAPKIRAMEILRRLEKEERKIYCGSIGFIAPGGRAVFNVAIRTLLIEDGQGECGVGGGIVWDSDPEAEFEECRLKALFLRRAIGATSV